MEIDHALGNRQSKPEPAVLARDDAPSLFERIEDFRDQGRFDPDAVVCDLDHNLMGLVVPCGQFEVSFLRRKFRGVLHEIPKDLLQSRGIGPATVSYTHLTL